MYYFIGSASGVVGEAVLVKGLEGNLTAGCASSGPQRSGHAPSVTLSAMQYKLLVEPCTVCHTLACLITLLGPSAACTRRLLSPVPG
jgi:hypothetical protein